MPRGFLVKRSKKSCAYHRIPGHEAAPGSFHPILEVLTPYTPTLAPQSEFEATDEKDKPGQESERVKAPAQSTPERSPIKVTPRLEQMDQWNQLSFSPVNPVDLDIKKAFCKRYLSSPASAESFPAAEPFASMEKFFAQGNPFLTPEAKLHASLGPRSIKLPCKRTKASRKLHFADEVTTSPVLGLKIKAEEPDRKSRLSQIKRPPLGEFICQLCKEHYPDPFALAQHKCSRIVRVEYRCPECEKIFSCPANLASHRRWHKPKALGADGQRGKSLQTPLEGKENSSGLSMLELQSAQVQHQHPVDSSRVPDQHQHPVDSSRVPDQHLHPVDSTFRSRKSTDTPGSQATSEEGDEEAFNCPYCHKRFRRHAYLLKHLLAHQPFNPLERGQHTFPCTLCGVHFPSMDIRDKHRLWHAVREELLIPLEEAMVAEAGQQIFPCELCPTAFFSAPGLTLHLSKCHSTEGRQEMPQQIPIGPGR
ncbi:insulinoma-associated protein 2 [Pelodytes ibericus]